MYCESGPPVMSSRTHFIWGFVGFTLLLIVSGIVAFWLVFKLV